MCILLLDTCVLIGLFEALYSNDRALIKRCVEHLQLRYFQIWVPRTVLYEFQVGSASRGRKHGRRPKPLPDRVWKYLLDHWPETFRECPVTVGINEIRAVTTSGLDAGEVDASLQGRKILSGLGGVELPVREVHFMSDDRRGLGLAKRLGLKTSGAQAFMDELEQQGIVLPATCRF